MRKNNTSKQSNKSLQKFTDFEEIKTEEEFLHLHKTEPTKLAQIQNWLIQRVNEETKVKGEICKYFNRLEKVICITYPNEIENCKRMRYQQNQSIIEGYIHNTIIKTRLLPSQTEIATETGLSRVTVAKHIKEGAGAKFFKEEIETYKILTPMVLNALYKIGVEDKNVKALTAFLDYSRDTSGGIRQQNNYIQINNTKIDEATINQLTPETRIEIEKLIINATR
jgi:hypothetical protein